MVVHHFLWAQQDARWNSDRRDRLVRISRKLVVEAYPQDPGFVASETLRMLDFSWAAEFLGLFPLEKVPEDRQTGFIVQLDSFPTEQARVQLERVAQSGWHDDYRVKDFLKPPLRPPPPADDWDYKVDVILQLLGDPTKSGERFSNKSLSRDRPGGPSRLDEALRVTLLYAL